MTEPSHSSEPAPGHGFRQHLGLFDATMLVAGSMIGSGIFIVSVFIAQDVGSAGWLMLLWVLTGFMTVIGALAFAELAAMMPSAGGQYVFLREAYGPMPAFLYGWTNFLVIQTGFIAAVGVAFAKFLGVLWPELGTGKEALLWSTPLDLKIAVAIPWMDQPMTFFEKATFDITRGQLVAVGIAVLLTAVNCLGVREGKWVQNIFTVAKVAGLLMLIVVGLTVARSAEAIRLNTEDLWGGIYHTKSFHDTFKIVPVEAVALVLVLCGAMVGALFSADAWANVTFAAGEVQNPRRNLPRALVFGTGLVIFLYLLANLAYLVALPVRSVEDVARKGLAEVSRLQAEIPPLEDKAGRRQNDAFRDAESSRHLRVEILRVEKEIAELKQQLTKLPKDSQERPATEAAIARNQRVLELFRDSEGKNRVSARQAEEEAAKLRDQVDQLRKKIKSEESRLAVYERPAFARGIENARDDRVAAAVLERVSPDFGLTLIAIAIMISAFGCVNGIVLAGARLYYAMARDGLFFQSVGQLSARGVPTAGLLLQGLWSIVLIFSGSYGQLLDYIVFAALVFYVITVAALFVLRWKHPEWPRPYRAFGYPVVPALYIALCAIIMFGLLIVKPVYSWPSFIIVLTGIPVFFLWRRRAA